MNQPNTPERSTEVVQPEIMTFERYAELKHDTPYIFSIEAGGKSLVYFGAHHSNDVPDPMFEQIRQEFINARPQVVFVEGVNYLATHRNQIVDELRKTDYATVIGKRGESGFTLKLAIEAGAEVESPEPDFKNEIEYLVEQGFNKESIFAYYIYRVAEYYHRAPKGVSIDEFLNPYVKEFQKNSGWENFDYSLDHLRNIGRNIWGSHGDLSVKNLSRVDPTPWQSRKQQWTEVNKVAQESSYFRDRFIVKRIADTLKERDRLFVIFGASHAYMQEPALRRLLEH